jgi:exodeoxyribonuclease V alpha subunit
VTLAPPSWLRAQARFPSPLGAARVHVAELRGEPIVSAALHKSIVSNLSGQDGVAEMVYLASEIVRLAVGLAENEERAFLLVIVACMAHANRGSTYLPIAEDDCAVLRSLLGEIGATDRDIATAIRLIVNTSAIPTSVDPRLQRIVGGASDYTPLVLFRGRLYMQRMLACESRVVAHLLRRIQRPPLATESDARLALADVMARPTFGKEGATSLSDEQQKAVLAAVALPFSAITGGPGTGKTSIVVSLLRTLARLHVSAEAMALAAPTGKAANRMAESLARSLDSIAKPSLEDESLLALTRAPETLHRLLGYSPDRGRFFHHENNKLAARVVVVDEASMIDLVLASALVLAVRDDARFVLLGDAEQLPAVDAGSVFRDIVRACVPGSVRLTHSYRMSTTDPSGSAILAAATAVNAGRSEALFGDPRSALKGLVTIHTHASKITFRGVELLEPQDADDDTLGAFLARWSNEHVFVSDGFERRARKVYHGDASGFSPDEAHDLAWLIEHYQRRRILTVTRSASLATGADAVNSRLHRALLDAFHGGDDGSGLGASAAEPARYAAYSLYPGEPVMVTHNDYTRGLFNGDQGVIVRVAWDGSRDHHFMAVFPRASDGTFLAFPLEALRRNLALAFATTVHKAQGSELDDVALVLPEASMPLLTREIVYTAISRARRSVAIVGARAVLSGAIAKQAARFSGVASMLAED